ncbi:MAG: hypothetical protein PHU25_13425 [Deltaproteobacteria bacterium]|nr:hypothetical protein [Deltaproteobacteria bacterium]
MRAVVVIAFAIALAGPRAFAEAGGDGEAKAAFENGKSLFHEGKYAEAADAFREANRLKPTWKLLYNIGQAEAVAKRYAKALEAFEAYLAQGGDEVEPERRDEVLREMERLRPLVGVIEVRAPAGVEVVVDGETAGVLPLPGPLRVGAGSHDVVLRERDRVLLRRQVTVAGTMTTVVEAPTSLTVPAAAPAPMAKPQPAAKTEEPKPRPKEPPKSPEPEEDKGVPWLTVGGAVAMVVGAAGIGIGGYFIHKGNGDYEDYKHAARSGDEGTWRTLKDDTIPGDKAGAVAGFVAGGALLVTGAVLLALDLIPDEGPGAAAAVGPGGLAVRF